MSRLLRAGGCDGDTGFFFQGLLVLPSTRTGPPEGYPKVPGPQKRRTPTEWRTGCLRRRPRTRRSTTSSHTSTGVSFEGPQSGPPSGPEVTGAGSGVVVALEGSSPFTADRDTGRLFPLPGPVVEDKGAVFSL